MKSGGVVAILLFSVFGMACVTSLSSLSFLAFSSVEERETLSARPIRVSVKPAERHSLCAKDMRKGQGRPI